MRAYRAQRSCVPTGVTASRVCHLALHSTRLCACAIGACRLYGAPSVMCADCGVTSLGDWPPRSFRCVATGGTLKQSPTPRACASLPTECMHVRECMHAQPCIGFGRPSLPVYLLGT
jgi:hypothetical protein